MEPEGLLPC